MKVGFLHTLLFCIAHGLWFDTHDTDYYAILGVRRAASLDEIKSSYKALMLELHPDRNKLDPFANEKAALLNEVYHTLRDEFRRAQYDRMHPSVGQWERNHYTHGQFAYSYFSRCTAYIWDFVKGEKAKKTSYGVGCFLAFTAKFVYRSPVMMFLLLWIVVQNKPHLVLMIWISAKFFKTKYLPYLVFLWIIYIIIMRLAHESLTSDFSSRILISLLDYPTLFVLSFAASVTVTFAVFWRFNPHRNQKIKLTIFLVQHVKAFLHLSETIGGASYLEVMIVQLIFIAISEICWIFFKQVDVRSDACELYAFCIERFRRTVNILMRFLQQSGACLNNLIILLSFLVESLLNLARFFIPDLTRIYHVAAIAVATLYNKTIKMCSDVFHCIFNTSHRRSSNEAHERRLLTNVEFVMEGRVHTQEQLTLLRRNCQRMPIMNTWRIARALSNTQRFAGFVLGEDHVTVAEREEHRRSSCIYPARNDEDQEDPM